MPRREEPHPFAIRVGRRIRTLRREAGLTIEKLAYESDLGSKGHLSSLEKGLVLPTVETLRVIADRLGVLPLDLVTFPEDSAREKLIDRTRTVSRKDIELALKRLPRSSR
jgi:transcriptional regulator with XRE-family HTH domain